MSITSCVERFLSNAAILLGTRAISAAGFLLFASFATTSPVSAIDDDRVIDASINVNDPHLSWAPGEMYDPMTGQMRYNMVDMVFEGNGQLPIVVSRSFGFDRARVTDVFASISGYVGGQLDVPTLIYRHGESGQPSDCRNLHLSADSDNPSTTQRLRTFIKFRMGTETRHFFSTDPDDQPAVVSQFPSTASYISSDNWVVQCVDTDSNGHYEFNIHSPDGITYIMNKMYSEDVAARNDSLTQARVTTVRDAYGNTLTYQYENGNRSQSNTNNAPDSLLNILASDKRSVTFTYDKFKNLIQAASNASPRPHIVDYLYSGLQTLNGSSASLFEVRQNNLLTTKYYGDAFFGAILRVDYPTGGWVEYTYNTEGDEIESMLFNQHDIGVSLTVQQRRQWDGGVYRFEHVPRGGISFSRIIRTPVSTIDHLYQKSSYRRSHQDPRDTRINDGRLLRKTVHAGSNAQSARTHEIVQPLSSLKFASQYTYTRLKWLSHYQTIDTQFVVMTKESRQLDSSGDFDTVYSKFDEYGRPLTITETNPTGRERVTIRKHLRRNYASNFVAWINGQLLEERVSDGTSQINMYNAYGDRKSEINNGVETKTAYYTAGPNRGHVHTVTDAEGNITTFENHFRGIARLQIDRTGRRIAREVNGDGTLQFETRLGDTAAWKYKYDALRRLTKVESPRAATVDMNIEWRSPTHRISYDDSAEKENWSETIMDGFGRVVFEGKKDRLNRWRSVVYEYDTMGNRIFESYPTTVGPTDFRNNPAVVGITTLYDAINRPIQVTREMGSTDSVQQITYGADSEGFLMTTERDGRFYTSTTTYNSFGSPSYRFKTEYVDKENVVTEYQRDVMGRVDAIERNGVSRTYIRDEKKQVTTEIHPETGSTTFFYHADGALRQTINGGRTVDYVYDDENRVSKVTHNDGQGSWVSRDYEYDSAGNLALLTNSSNDGNQNNSITYTYDKEENVLTESFRVDSRTYTMTYEYDQHSNQRSIRYPSGRRYQYSPNIYGEPHSIEADDGKVIYNGVTYNPNGIVSQMNRDSHQMRVHLDSAQRPWRREILLPRGLAVTGSIEYDYDNESNVVEINDTFNGSLKEFDYDRSNRLTSAVISDDDNWTFTYDRNDNLDFVRHGRRTIDYVYEPRTQRLTGISSNVSSQRRFNYDDRGNIISLDMPVRGQPGAMVNRTLAVNAANQITWTNTRPSASSYGYDGRGLRIKTSQNGTVYTIYDGRRNLRYRHDVGADISSEYFYVANQMIARRDTQNSSAGGSSTGSPSTAVCVDTAPVGDGYGWDGTQSCRVPTNGGGAVCVDVEPVGDGFGWDGTQSCRI